MNCFQMRFRLEGLSAPGLVQEYLEILNRSLNGLTCEHGTVYPLKKISQILEMVNICLPGTGNYWHILALSGHRYKGHGCRTVLVSSCRY